MGEGQMWKQAGVGACFLVVLVGCAAVLLTVTAATAEPKAIVVLSSLHNLDYAEAACSHLRRMADIKDITEVLNNASDYDPEDVKFNKQLFDGIWECKSVKADDLHLAQALRWSAGERCQAPAAARGGEWAAEEAGGGARSGYLVQAFLMTPGTYITR
jgi:hypothetical protein